MAKNEYTFKELNPRFESTIDQDAIIALSGTWASQSDVDSERLDMAMVNPLIAFINAPAPEPTKGLKEAIQSKLDEHGYVVINNLPWKDKSVYEEEVEQRVDFFMEMHGINERAEKLELSAGDKAKYIEHLRCKFREENSPLQIKIQQEKSILRAIIDSVGKPVVFEGEGNDDDISVIKASKQIAEGETSFKTSNEFSPHTDMSYAENPPDFMALYTGQTDRLRHAQSVFAPVDAAIKLLDPETIEELLKPQFDFALPNRADGKKKKWYNGLTSYFQRKSVRGSVLQDIGNGQYHVRFRRDTLSARNEKATKALDKLAKAFEKVSFAYAAQPGSIVIVDNRRVLHGRTPFIATHDDDDRYVLRAYADEAKHDMPIAAAA